MHASAAQQGCMQRPAAYSRRLRLQPRADAAARLRGEPRRVQRWIADVRHWSSFYPGTKSAVKLGNGQEPIRVGSKFELQREMLGLKLPMAYEVLELEPGKRLVLSGLSEHHTQMDQFFFMPDRHDASFCAVRYITDVRLREWRAYLQPLAARYMAKVPDETVAGLQRALNTQHSPLFAGAFDAAYRAEGRSGGASSSSSRSGTSRSGTTAGSRGRSRAGTGSSSGGSRTGGGGWSLRDLFGSGNRRSQDEVAAASAGASSSSSIDGDIVLVDPMGYYRLLGLSPADELAEEALRSAYRKLALQLHPDRQLGKDAAAREAAAAEFALLLKAYDTLRDPEQRRLYNAGQLLEATLNL